MTRDTFARMTGPVLGLILLGLLPGCGEKGEEPAPTPPTVEFVTVEQKDVPIYGEWVGTLEGEVNATISAQVSGYLLSREYQEGSRVTNGQMLFQIDDRTYKAALDQAEARVVKTEQDVQRYIPLAKSQAISQQELDDAIQSNAAAVAAAEQARLNYQFCKILSPLDGVAGLAQAQVGDLLGPGSGPLTTVAQIDPIRVYFSVSQQLMSEIQEHMLAAGKKLRDESGNYEGPPLQLTLASGAVYPEPGRVRFANNQVDVKTGTVRVVGEFPNPHQLLVPGMFTRVRALLNTETNALLVPQRVVTETQGRYLVAVVGTDNKISIQPVTVGERIGPLWIIKGNVQAGERVVAEGIQKVRDGTVVNPVPQGMPPEEKAAEAKPVEHKD